MLRRSALAVLGLAVLCAVPVMVGCGGGNTGADDGGGDGWTQPATGPGSAVYPHAACESFQSGTAAQDFTLFTPASPRPASAPVIVFSHGWSWVEPSIYGAWLSHIARRGNIVICPRYQALALDANGSAFLPNAIAGVKAAIQRLQTAGPVQPDLTKFALLGHSVGGTLTADMAAVWAANGLPRPLAVFSVEPGTLSDGLGLNYPDDVTEADFSQIAAGTLLVSLQGSDDALVGSRMAVKVYQESTGVAAGDKNLLTVRTDTHNGETLTADHYFPRGDVGETAALTPLDFYGLWKIFDGLTDAAFYGTNRAYALGNTPQQRYMGAWPDGTPIRELEVE